MFIAPLPCESGHEPGTAGSEAELSQELNAKVRSAICRFVVVDEICEGSEASPALSRFGVKPPCRGDAHSSSCLRHKSFNALDRNQATATDLAALQPASIDEVVNRAAAERLAFTTERAARLWNGKTYGLHDRSPATAFLIER